MRGGAGTQKDQSEGVVKNHDLGSNFGPFAHQPNGLWFKQSTNMKNKLKFLYKYFSLFVILQQIAPNGLSGSHLGPKELCW